MRKSACLLVLLMLLTAISFTTVGCKNTHPEVAEDSLQTEDTLDLVDTAKVDSMDSLISQQPMPKAADELFDDFFFNFAANKKLQHSRIHFPLPVYHNGKVTKLLEKKEWQMEHFFMRQGFYTLIFDNERQMKLGKDTSINHVVVEYIQFNIRTVKQYLFNRINGQWMLTSLNYKSLGDNVNSSFLSFYERFAADSAFQVESLNEEMAFSAPDPDDDFSIIDGTITPEQWDAYKPGLIPGGSIYNINYGQKYSQDHQKIFLVRGISNGLEIEMVFRKRSGGWKLVKFST